MKIKQLNIRLTDRQKKQIENFKKINGYDSLTSYIIDSALNRVKKGGNVAGKIVTLTLSPCVDYVINFDEQSKLFEEQPNIFDTQHMHIRGAGKGIYQSKVIDSFGIPTVAIHYSGGFAGSIIEDELREVGVPQVKLNSKQNTRINLKVNLVKDELNTNYELNGKPPLVDETAQEKIQSIVKELTKLDILSIAGSYNRENFPLLEGICKRAAAEGIEFVLDISSKDILKLLKYRPHLIKPNIFQLKYLTGKELNSEEEIIAEMKILKGKGARNVIVTMGEDGALMMDKNSVVWKATIINPVELVSRPGSGDAFIGAYLVSYFNKEEVSAQLKWASAAGTAKITKYGLPDIKEIRDMFHNIKINKINI